MPEPDDPPRRSRLGLALAIVLPALIAAGAVLWIGAEIGQDALPAASPRADSSPRTLGVRASRGLRPVVASAGRGGVRGNDLEDLAGGVRPAVPDKIEIPAARVDTVVDAVGTGLRGAIRVPSLGRAGWWQGGPRPGEPGRAVVIGHLDTEHGPGLFARVPALRRDQAITITDRRGRVYRYLVVGRHRCARTASPPRRSMAGPVPRRWCW